MGPSVTALENQYFLLRGSLSTLMRQGATPEQVDLLKSQIAKSRDNYWTATNRTFHDDDPAVEALVTQINTEQVSLEATIQHLGKIAEIIDAITKAVQTGSLLLAKASAL